MGVTIKKIAADLNIAVSTVSKALRDSHEISQDTKARILEYAAKMDYTPNPYASSLKGKRSGNIAVVLPEVADSFFSSAIDGIEEIAQQKGYHVMVYLTHEDALREQSIIREFRNGRVDGVLMSIVANNRHLNHLDELCAGEMPLVFFDRVCEGTKAACVVTDDFESGFKAAQHLIDKGCKRIAFLSISKDLGIINERQAGFEKALHENGFDPKKNPIIYCTNNEAENILQIKNILKSKSRPNGIVGSVEKLTTQLYAVCHAQKLAIPNDIRIIGFSHLQIAALLNPSLTTITQPAFEMGKAAAKILFKALEQKKTDLKNQRIVIPSVLVERDSTQ